MRHLGKSLLILLAAAWIPCGCSRFQTVPSPDFSAAVTRDSLQLVDVRTPSEFEEGHLPGAINLDVRMNGFADSALTRLDASRGVAVYCRSGKRSAAAAAALSRKGFRGVNLDGGILAWKEAGMPVADRHDYLVSDGDLAPDFTVNLMDGSQRTLSALRGKVVMLQFTASWCGVCRREMPHIENRIWQRHKENPDFVLIGIDREEDRQTMERFIQLTGITYPLGFDPVSEIFDKYAVHNSGITRNVLINKDGRIVLRTRLYNEAEFGKLVSAIDSLLIR